MLYVVRHGQTDWNLQGKIQGQVDVPLNSFGISQAYSVRDVLNGVPFSVVFSSPLLRAKMTATIISDNRFPIVFDHRIVERNFGEFEGLSKEDFDTYSFWNYNLNCFYDKAENVRSFLNRVYNFLDEYKEIYEKNDVLVVTHSGVVPAICCYFDGIPKHGNLFSYHLKNCEVLKFI